MIRTKLIERSIPAEAKKPCDAPMLLRTGKVSELRTALARDGKALSECEMRRRLAVEGTP